MGRGVASERLGMGVLSGWEWACNVVRNGRIMWLEWAYNVVGNGRVKWLGMGV